MAKEVTRFLILGVILISSLVEAHIPMGYYKSAESDSPVFVSQDAHSKLSRESSAERLNAVRSVLAANGINAYIVPTADAHNSQYIAPADARREWVCGLLGSSGTALVTASEALVWTDARYFTQFEVQVDTSLWTLMRQGEDVTINVWLQNNLPPNSIVGVDPTTYTRSSWNSLQNALDQVNITLVPTFNNLIDEARRSIDEGPPARPSNGLIALTTEFTGKASHEKISELISQIQSREADALILTALDEVAYTLNLRGTDIPYNPVFFAYLVIRADINTNNVILFWNDGVLSNEIVQHLASEGVQVDARPYDTVFDYLRNLGYLLPTSSQVLVSEDGSHAVYLALETGADANNMRLISTVSPVALTKVIKNEVELEGFRRAHIKDGVAVVRGMYWVHRQVDAGHPVTEVELSDKLEELRSEEALFMGPSFATIAGAGENGAIIHYKPEREGEQRVIGGGDMLLVDSGGQYMDGTTDITRTRHMGTPTVEQRRAFTRVLKGQINMGTAVFPSGTLGHVIEVLARKYLWEVGLNYGHGTGHGLGHFLNVHEGPSWILSGPAANDPGIRPRMVYSNEPGYYEVGEYGIRHEDVVETILMTPDVDHIMAEHLASDFEGRGAVGFYTISLAPHQTSVLDISLLNDMEIKYINDYHSRVLSTIGPILQDRGYLDEYEWLQKECAPIGRSSAILVQSVPFLTFISVFTLWFGR